MILEEIQQSVAILSDFWSDLALMAAPTTTKIAAS
jgi:hypothetical protein